MRISPGGVSRVVLAPLATLTLTVGLSACHSGQVPLAVASSPATGSERNMVPVATALASEERAPARAGALSASVSAPVIVLGHVATPVLCATGGVYQAEESRATIDGNRLRFTVGIVGYHGTGSYSAVVAVTLDQASGVVTTLAGVSQVPATITRTGGSFSVKAIGREGRPFTGSLHWVCGK
jgi:hypothetical protein